MQNEVKDNTGLLYINVPMNMKEKLELAFPTKSEKEMMKVFFLIHKINKEKTYQVNITDHADGLSIRRGEVTEILNTLINLFIIKKVSGYKVGVKSNSYSMVHSFNHKSNDCYTKLYDAKLHGCPAWVTKYIKNHGVMLSNKKGEAIKPDNNQLKDAYILSLEAKVKALEEELKLAFVALGITA